MLLADTEGRQGIMAEFLDRFGLLAEQQIDEVFGAEPLAGPENCGHRLLRGDGAINHDDIAAAHVAIPARRRGLAEIAEQGLAPAARRLAERDERVEAQPVDVLLLIGSGALLDLAAAQSDVAGAVEGERIGGQSVAAGAADLLVIALDVVRHVGVADEAHVGLVDPHAERDRRHHDDAVLLQECILVARAVSALHAGVIGQCLDAFIAQEFRKLLRQPARGAINDAAVVAVAREELQDLPAAIAAGAHGEAQVRPVEAVDKNLRRLDERAAPRCRCASRRRPSR